jgi:hypothetical protein
MKHSLPLFLIIGEQKTGTTFLRYLLSQHALLQPGNGFFGYANGEPHFFDWAIEVKGIQETPAAMAEAYSRHFTSSVAGVFHFDTSPSYLSWPGPVPRRVRAVMGPHAKLVLLLRDPVRRYDSAVRMVRCRPNEVQEREPVHQPGRLEEYLERKSSALHLTRGFYLHNIQRWLEFFDREQLFIADSDALFMSPQGLLEEILEFIGLPSFHADVPQALGGGRNQGGCAGVQGLTDDEIRALCGFYRRSISELEDFIGYTLGWCLHGNETIIPAN